jgi:hypothetical protein
LAFPEEPIHPPFIALLEVDYDPDEWARKHMDTVYFINKELPELVPQTLTHFLPE